MMIQRAAVLNLIAKATRFKTSCLPFLQKQVPFKWPKPLRDMAATLAKSDEPYLSHFEMQLFFLIVTKSYCADDQNNCQAVLALFHLIEPLDMRAALLALSNSKFPLLTPRNVNALLTSPRPNEFIQALHLLHETDAIFAAKTRQHIPQIGMIFQQLVVSNNPIGDFLLIGPEIINCEKAILRSSYSTTRQDVEASISLARASR
jgi:hypothetical protein